MEVPVAFYHSTHVNVSSSYHTPPHLLQAVTSLLHVSVRLLLTWVPTMNNRNNIWILYSSLASSSLLPQGHSNSIALCTIGFKKNKQFSHLVGPPFLALMLWTGSFWLRALIIEISLISGCGNNHNSAQDSYGTCVNFSVWYQTELEIWFIYKSHGLKVALESKI